MIEEIFNYVKSNPGVTATELMRHFGEDNPMFGRQRPVNSAIAQLRAEGRLVDDCNRCEHCGGASRKGRRNVPLYVTTKALVGSIQ